MARGYQILRFWSPLLGDEAMRLSMVDKQGDEHFMVLPAARGKAYREAKATALEKIGQAIEAGHQPGEVA